MCVNDNCIYCIYSIVIWMAQMGRMQPVDDHASVI